MAKKIAGVWESLGGKLQKKTQTNMVWLDLEDVGIGEEKFSSLGRENGLQVSSRLVVHYQISDEAISKLEEVMRVVIADRGQNECAETRVGHRVYGSTTK